MSTVRFAKLERQEKSLLLCRLAEEQFSNGKRVLIRVQDENQAVALDRFLWTWDKGAFLPHALHNGSVDCLDEPIVITAIDENPNAASVLIMGSACPLDFMRQFPLTIDFAEVYDPKLADRSRQRFRSYKEHGFNPQMY